MAADQRYNCKESSLGAGWAIHPANAQVAGNNIRFALMEFPLFTVSLCVKIITIMSNSSRAVSRVLILEQRAAPPLGKEWVVLEKENHRKKILRYWQMISDKYFV